MQTNQYDGLNRRIVRDETGVGGNRRHFYYNQQWQVLEERVEVAGTINANPLSQYVYNPNYVDAIAVRFYDANTDGLGLVAHYYLQDANFNVTAVADSAGTVVERYSYTPYGEVTVLNPDFSAIGGNVSAISNELLYTGRRRDPETGLQLNRNRFYASRLGRWVNRDPNGQMGRQDVGVSDIIDSFDPMADYDDGLNLYQYVGGSPLRELDPSGLLFGFGYGNYCGWSRRGQKGTPIDALDSACKRHDKCQATWWTCNPYHISKCSFQLCDGALDAKRFGCVQSHPNNKAKRDACIKAAKKVAALFCTITGQTISPGSPVFD